MSADSSDVLDRYSRQVRFPGLKEAGQRRLLASRVTICGCGALGTVLANHLARAGVGHIRLVDRDFIETHSRAGLRPHQELLVDPPPGVRAAVVPDGTRALIYAPWPTALTLAVDEPAEWTASQWTLEDRRHPRITIRPGELYVDNPAAMGDSVLLLTPPAHPAATPALRLPARAASTAQDRPQP